MSFRPEVDLLTQMLLNATPAPIKKPELRVYYNDQGKIVTYTCEDLPGDYLVITPQQFAEARPDAIVKNGKLVYTHTLSHVTKLARAQTGVKTSEWDINILVGDNQPGHHWDLAVNEVRAPE